MYLNWTSLIPVTFTAWERSHIHQNYCCIPKLYIKMILKSFDFQYDFDFQITTSKMILILNHLYLGDLILILKLSTYDDFNAKSLACDTANEHALTCTRETCSCSQTAVQWNQWRCSIHTYSNVGNIIPTVNSPMYDTYIHEYSW